MLRWSRTTYISYYGLPSFFAKPLTKFLDLFPGRFYSRTTAFINLNHDVSLLRFNLEKVQIINKCSYQDFLHVCSLFAYKPIFMFNKQRGKRNTQCNTIKNVMFWRTPPFLFFITNKFKVVFRIHKNILVSNRTKQYFLSISIRKPAYNKPRFTVSVSDIATMLTISVVMLRVKWE